MQREDVDEYLRMYENDEFDNLDKVKKLLDRIGIEYTETADGLNFDSQLFRKQFVDFFRNDKEYVRNMDKKLLGELVSELPEIVDEEYLKRIVINSREYGLKTDKVFDFVIKINDPDFTKEIIERSKEYGFDNKSIVALIESVNDVNYTKEIIENNRNYGFDNFVILDLVKSINDLNYTNELIENREKYNFDEVTVMFLIEGTNDLEFIKEVIKDRAKYGINDGMLVHIVNSTHNKDFLKELIQNKEEYGINDVDTLWELIGLTNDTDFIKEIIDNNERYGFNSNEIKEFTVRINDPNYTKEIIERREEVGFNTSELLDLVRSTDDTEFIKKVIKDREQYDLSDGAGASLINMIPEEEIIETLKMSGGKVPNIYRQRYANIEFIKENLDELLGLEAPNIDKNLLLEMAEKNEDIFKVDFDILDSKYINLLGKDKINQIASYPYIVDRVLKLNDGELNLFSKALDGYIEETKGEEWTPLASRILKNIEGYGELISNLEGKDNVDIGKIIPILIHQNDFDIKTYDDVENFKEIKRKRCEELIKGETVEEKQKAVLLKIFGQGTNEAQELISKFGQDIDKIQDEDLRAYIKSQQEILNTKNPKALEEIFEQVEELETNNPLAMERMLKTEYWKLYNNDLFKVEDARKLPDGENVYSAGTDFKMIITSVGAYHRSQPDDYAKDWNRASLGSQHFCASYIRNDMLGHAPMPHICYGFEEMKEDALMLSGPGDIYSSGVSFESTAQRGEKYLAPDSQIGNTTRYNEMDFRRVQGGEKKQPDYIVIFRKDGRIDNMDKAQKASKDFGGLPIIVIDEDECLAAEKQKAEELFQEYQKTGDSEVKAKLQEKLRNNRVTNDSFCRDTNMDAVLEDTKQQGEPEKIEEDKQEVSMEDLGEIYEEVSGKERQEEAVRIKAILTQIRDIKRGEVSDGER